MQNSGTTVNISKQNVIFLHNLTIFNDVRKQHLSNAWKTFIQLYYKFRQFKEDNIYALHGKHGEKFQNSSKTIEI